MAPVAGSRWVKLPGAGCKRTPMVAGNIVDDEIELSARAGAGAGWIDATFEEAVNTRLRHQAEYGTIGEVELRHAVASSEGGRSRTAA